jgi:hypothetical protein
MVLRYIVQVVHNAVVQVHTSFVSIVVWLSLQSRDDPSFQIKCCPILSNNDDYAAYESTLCSAKFQVVFSCMPADLLEAIRQRKGR